MTRMIERWFPCTEVSDASMSGWGSGNTEASLWVWFAKRPTAQAKAAVLTSLLPWPEDERDQQDLQKAVRAVVSAGTPATVRAPNVRDAFDKIRAALHAAYPGGARVLDPFSGRAMIPLEAGRLGVHAEGIDYSPFATLGGSLLAEIPFQDWTRRTTAPLRGRRQQHDHRRQAGPGRESLPLRGGPTLHRQHGRVLPVARWRLSLGLLVGIDAAVRGMRKQVPARGRAVAPVSARGHSQA